MLLAAIASIMWIAKNQSTAANIYSLQLTNGEFLLRIYLKLATLMSHKIMFLNWLMTTKVIYLFHEFAQHIVHDSSKNEADNDTWIFSIDLSAVKWS